MFNQKLHAYNWDLEEVENHLIELGFESYKFLDVTNNYITFESENKTYVIHAQGEITPKSKLHK